MLSVSELTQVGIPSWLICFAVIATVIKLLLPTITHAVTVFIALFSSNAARRNRAMRMLRREQDSEGRDDDAAT